MSSSSFGLFKRPRSKSEKQVRPQRTVFGDFSSAYSSIAGRSPNLPSASVSNAEVSGIASPESQDPTPLLSTIPDSPGRRRVGSDSPGLVVAGEFFQPGPSLPTGSHRQIPLLQSSPPPVSPRLVASPPPVIPSEIGTKFPVLSYEPGVDRRMFHNPNIKSPRPPPENTVTETDRHAHRRSASMTDLTLLYDGHPSPLNFQNPAGLVYSPNLPFDASPAKDDSAGRRPFGSQHSEQTPFGFQPFHFPEPQANENQPRIFSNDNASEERVEDLLTPNVFLESRAQNSRDYFEDHRSDMRNFMNNEGTSGSDAYENLDAYEQAGEYDNNIDVQYESDEEVGHDASSLYDIQPIRSRHLSDTSSLGKYMWSPRGSLDTGSVFGADVEAQPYIDSGNTQGPAGPPSTPLPQLPSQSFQNIDRRAYRDISSTTEQYSHSSESYGNTRNLLGLPQSRIPSGQNSARSFARLSFVNLEGSVHSRSLSEVETRELEDEIRVHLQPNREANMLEEHTHDSGQYQHSHHHAGSLSISYLRTESQAGESSPVSSQGSSAFGLELHARENPDRRETKSGREVQLGFYDDSHSQSRVRSGTPPLLFGRRALGSNDLEFPEQMPSGVMSNGRLAQFLAAARLRSDSRLIKAVAGDEDGDWETETGSGTFTKKDVREQIAQGETGSSYADNSDSGSLSQFKVTKGLSTEHVVQHSPHARYSQNWTLLQDIESGNMVLAPDPQKLTSEAATRSPYHHPSPLSKEHTHPFNSSPPLGKSTQASPLFDKSSRFEARSVRSHQSWGREKVTSETFHKESPLSRAILSGFGTGTMSDGRHDVSSRDADRKGISYPSSAWLSTVDGDAVSDHSDVLSGDGSFSKIATLGAKANVTGTPEGSGARQVGSSLADASSPNVASSPFVQHTSPSNSRTKAKADLSPEVRRQRQDLVEHLLLSPLPEPPASEPKRLSVPLELLTTRGSSTMANKPPNTVGMRVGGSMPQFIPNSPGHQVRKRSPHRQASTGDLAVDVESEDDHQVRTPAPSPLQRGKMNLTRSYCDDSIAAASETEQAQSQAVPGYPGGLPYDSMYGDFLREMRGASAVRAVCPPMRQRQYNRPIAPAESPHLHRIPGLTIDEALARQKELSTAYLWGFVPVFPLLLPFGHGLMDGLMAWHTGGELTTFRDEEKVVALWVGYGVFAAVFAGLCITLALLLG